MSDEFHSDETILTSHETLVFSLLDTSAKLMIFNAMKPFMKLSLRLVSYFLLPPGHACYSPGENKANSLVQRALIPHASTLVPGRDRTEFRSEPTIQQSSTTRPN